MPTSSGRADRSPPRDRLSEAEARAAWLVRAFETPLAAPWRAEDADWATREALRCEGEHASPARFIARRAALAAERLAQRGVVVKPGLSPGTLAAALASAAFVLGLLSESVASARHINILAPPLLALLAWNLGVYVLLIASWLTRPVRARGTHDPNANSGPLRRAWQAVLAVRLGRQGPGGSGTAAALARFAEGWARASRPLSAARVSAVLHAAAAALALGALLSLYARGLAFEYRAGWDSTFLSARAVHALLAAVLGPASQLSGIALPDAGPLERLRFSQGPGENAAPWIHLHAITLILAVVLPRLVLAATSAWRSRRVAQALPQSLDDAYFGPLWRMHTGRTLPVRVRPYSYRVDPSLHAGLRAAVARDLGAPVQLQVDDPVAQGAEDETMPPADGAVQVALFPLTATPEHETHGAFVRALARSGGALRVVVDESGFRRRFTGAEGAARLAQRRAAWERLLRDEGVEPLFMDLAASAEPAGDAVAAR
jgi:hypothetical protein